MWTILPPTAENEITFFYPHLCNGNETEQYYLVPPLDTSQTMSMGRRNPTEVSNWICFTTQNLLEYANEIKTNPRSIYSTQFTSFRCHYQLHFFLTVVVVAELLVKSMHFKIKIDKKRKYFRWTTHMMSYLSLLWDHLFIIFHGFYTDTLEMGFPKENACSTASFILFLLLPKLKPMCLEVDVGSPIF